MNFVIIGAGAVGGFLGARLQNSGNKVTFLVRRKRYEQLRDEGLIVQSEGKVMRLPVKAITDPSEVDQCDVLLIAVKSYSLSEVIESVRNLSQRGAYVVSFLNGIEQMERIRSTVPDEKIAGGVIHLQAMFDGQKVIQQGLEASIILGSLSKRPHAFVQSISETFANAQLKTSVSENILLDLWKKYIFITILSSLTGVCNAPIGPILQNKDTYYLFEEIASEAVSVAKAVLSDMSPPTIAQVCDQINNLPENMTASMARDLERGLPTEVEYIQGYMVKKAKQLGLSVPATTFCYRVLKLREKGPVNMPKL